MLALDLELGLVQHYGLAALFDLRLAGSGKSGPNALAGRIGLAKRDCGVFRLARRAISAFSASAVLSKVVAVTYVTIARAENDAGIERMSFENLCFASISSP